MSARTPTRARDPPQLCRLKGRDGKRDAYQARPEVRPVAPYLDLVRLFVGVAVLSFAAYTDWQWRRAPNVLWLLLAGLGAVLLAVETALDPAAMAARWPYLAFVPAFAAIVYALWWFGLIAGGADAKALMAIGVLLPFPLLLTEGVPVIDTPMPAAFSVLGNSLLAFLVVPVGLAAWNVIHRDFAFPYLFLGVRREAAQVQRGHTWPMETVDADGNRRKRLFASRMEDSEIEETFARVQALGKERVWVTPKVPFMIPLLVGYVATFTVGDLFTGAMLAFLP